MLKLFATVSQATILFLFKLKHTTLKEREECIRVTLSSGKIKPNTFTDSDVEALGSN